MMIRMWNRATQNATIMTWTNQFVAFGSSLFVLPLLLKKFDEIEISFWFLLNIFLQLTILADSGFGPTLVRAVSYFKAGARELPKNKKEFEKAPGGQKKANLAKLTNLLYTSKRIYNFVSWGAVFLICSAGVLISWNVFVLSNYREDFIFTYFLIIINSYLILQIVRWKSFMVGLDFVAKVNRFNTVVGLFRLLFFIAILIIIPSILYMIAFKVISSVITLIYIRGFVRKWFISQGCKLNDKQTFDKNIFQSIWSATWKMGGIQWGNYLINYGTSIIIAQINNTSLMADFLFTQRIIFIFRRISEAPFFANIQKVYGLIAQKKYETFKEVASQYIFLVLIILISSLTITMLLGNWVLSLLSIETRLVSTDIFIILSLAIIFEVHAAMHRNIYISTNQVPFLLPILISGVVFIILGFLVLPYYGLFGVVLLQFLIQFSFNYWFPVILSFRLMNWDFLSYIKGLYIFGFKRTYHQVSGEFQKNK